MESRTETLDNQGVHLVYKRCGHPEGPAVAFLHGLMESSGTFASIAMALPECDVFLLDLRGHGKSNHTPGHYRIPDFSADAICLLEQAVKRPAFLVGHSLGAVAAAHIGQHRADLLRGLVLEDPPLYLGDRTQWTASVFSMLFPVMRRVVCELQGRGATPAEFSEFMAAAGSFVSGTMGEELTEPAIERMGQSLAAMDTSLWDDAISGMLWDGFDEDATIGCPALLLQADPKRGPAFMPAHANRLRTTSANIQIIEVLGSGHFIHNSRRSEESYLRHLKAFINRLA